MKTKNLLLTFTILATILVARFFFWSSKTNSLLVESVAATPKTVILEPAEKVQASPPKAPVTAAQTGKPETKAQVLDEIFRSRNDNDPRLDTDFRNLSNAEKDSLRGRYSNLSKEKLNERGTLVFLLGREIKNKEDIDFMAQVLEEPVCLSMADCQTPASRNENDDTPGEDVTLAYPQLVSLKSLGSLLVSVEAGSPLVGSALQTLEKAKKSKNPLIARMAEDLWRKHSGAP